MPIKHALKTAIAALLATIYYQSLHLSEGYWAVISSVIVMQSNVGSSFKASWSRFFGTAIGALSGTIWVLLLGSNIWSVAISVFLTIIICTYLKMEESYRLASITGVIVILASGSEPSWLIGFHRFINVSLGILIAILVTLVIFPNHADKTLKENTAKLLTDCGQLYELLFTAYRQGDYNSETINNLRTKVRETFRLNETLFSEYLQEPGQIVNTTLADLINSQKRIIELISSMDKTASDEHQHSYHLNLDPYFPEVAKTTVDIFNNLANAFNRKDYQLSIEPLDLALNNLEKKLLSIRESGISKNYNLEEIIGFYSFFYNLQEIAKELKIMTGNVTKLVK